MKENGNDYGRVYCFLIKCNNPVKLDGKTKYNGTARGNNFFENLKELSWLKKFWMSEIKNYG